MKTIYELQLHEMTLVKSEVENKQTLITVIRVPGGWIYFYDTVGCFVPFKNEITYPINFQYQEGQE